MIHAWIVLSLPGSAYEDTTSAVYIISYAGIFLQVYFGKMILKKYIIVDILIPDPSERIMKSRHVNIVILELRDIPGPVL